MAKMGMHVKSDSEVTSVQASTPPRSPRRPLYFVQSPSHSHSHSHHHHDLLDKMSDASTPTPIASPTHHHPHHHYLYHYHYHCSPIHHSRESSTSRFSATSLKNPKTTTPAAPSALAWNRILPNPNHHPHHAGLSQLDHPDDDDEDYHRDDKAAHLRFYVLCFLLSFLALFTIFSLILWATSIPYKPKIFVKSIVFESFNVQAGMDGSGVPTDMLTLNSSVKIFFRNPATFFGVHVTSTPLQLHYYDLMLASGMMKKFYQSRKSQHMVVVVVRGYQVPLYGGVPVLSEIKNHPETASVPLNLTFQMRSRAYILGRLVKPKFYRNILCEVTLRGNHLGKAINLTNSEHCVYR